MTPEDKHQLEESIINALKSVYDPEIPVDIYELGRSTMLWSTTMPVCTSR